MAIKIFLLSLLLTLTLSANLLNEDQQKWVQVPLDRLAFLTNSGLFNQIDTQARNFWLQQTEQQLGAMIKVEQLIMSKAQFFRITYLSITVHEYPQVIITVRYDQSEQKKISVTRSVPPVLNSDNIDGYISRY